MKEAAIDVVKSRDRFSLSALATFHITHAGDTRNFRDIALRICNSISALKSSVDSNKSDVDLFSCSKLGDIASETLICIFDEVARQEGVSGLLRLHRLCKWTHFLIRGYMHSTLQEQACRLACGKAHLCPVSKPATYVGCFWTELRSALVAQLVGNAFAATSLHCAAAHCRLSFRAYNRTIATKLAKNNSLDRLRREGTGLIRVAYHTSSLLAPCHDVPVAFVATRLSLIHI